MYLTFVQFYVIAINIIAFILYTIDFFLHIKHKPRIRPKMLCYWVTIFGGAFGSVLAVLIWDDWKTNKINALPRIYLLIWMTLQLTLFWILWGPNHETTKFQIISFFNNHKILCIYYIVINIITFIMFAIDKIKAMLGAWRIKEVVLLGLCIVGGGFGGILAMNICNHKVNSSHFVVGVPLMICCHLIMIVLIVAIILG